MEVVLYDGTKEKSEKIKCGAFEDAEKLLRECALKPLAMLFFDYENSKSTSLSVNINGELATLTFFSEEDGEDGEDIVCDDYEEFGESCLWFSIGGHKDKVRFLNGKGMKTDFTEGEFVVTLEQAIECVKQFFESSDLPSCIEWERIS